MPIKKGESITFTASPASVAPRQMAKPMDPAIAALDSRDSFYHCLVNAAHQFKVQKDGENYLLAGYPWFKCRARDMFIAMPGITLSIGEVEMYEKYMETAAKAIRSYINK